MQPVVDEHVSIRQICSVVNRLAKSVEDLKDSLDMLECEALAVGNLLVKKKIITIKELDTYTALMVKQKEAEKAAGRRSGPIPALREEFEEAIQQKIKQ